VLSHEEQMVLFLHSFLEMDIWIAWLLAC